MNNESIWSNSIQIQQRPPLSGDITTEVAIIGAGLAGILTAYLLHNNGLKVVIIEADRIASGQTKNTTAKITSQHGAIYQSLIHKYGEDNAHLYAKANQDAIKEYGKIIKTENIDCHFEKTNSYLYSKKDKLILLRESEAAQKLGIPAHYMTTVSLPFKTQGTVCFENQAQFNPLEFIYELSNKLIIYENTIALKICNNTVETTSGNIKAEHIVMATHYPFPIVPGLYFARQHQERSYVLALSGIPKSVMSKGMYYGTSYNDLSFRWYNDLLLVGGGGHRTGEKTDSCGFRHLESQALSLFPYAKVVARWAAQDCVSHDDLYFAGHFSYFRKNHYVISGLKKWGMTGSMVAAKIVSDTICNVPCAYAELFSPQRCHPIISWNSFWDDMKCSTVNLTRGIFYNKNPQCSHMGCELKWNEEEKTWDCPCHGSRYDDKGQLLDNPAKKDITSLQKK